MWWDKGNLLALCLVLVALCFEQCGSTTSNRTRDVLSGLIESGGRLVSLVFRNQVVQPDVKINGTGVMKSKDGSCIVGNSLVQPPDFCSTATIVTLYHGDPPSPQNFTGSELCSQFPHVEPTRESEENSCSWGSILGPAFGIPGVHHLILIAIFVIGSCCYYWKCLKKKDKVSGEESLKFGEPLNQDVENANGGQSNVMPDNFDGEQPGAVPNIFDHFLDEVGMILREAREGVLTILSLRQVCRRASCQPAACSHQPFDMHVKLGNTEVAIKCGTCTLNGDLAIAFLENMVKEMNSYKEDSCRSKCFQGFLFYHNTISDGFDLSYLENQTEGKDVSLYKVETTSGTEPRCFRMFKDMLRMLIRQQVARLSDYQDSEKNAQNPVPATENCPDRSATVMNSLKQLRERKSRSTLTVRSVGDEPNELTPFQDGMLMPFTGGPDEYNPIDHGETEL